MYRSSTSNFQAFYLECSGWECNGRAGGSLPSHHLPSLPLEVGPLKSSWRVWGAL